ncbi:unnamed protein product [Rotaria socialis]|uniref:MD-2-related lipid-recognition domain-containing protein n=2 Tax=Rotaria socialis TaxID=392032 RepID=A0A818C7X3_9BILA|nr:unnamed protein product [Rotaria socialis]CAF3410075.1 unnamed protein product [Rotaria socialis]CAF3428538.1 unnamed protein product [Rotaria socialis]CAF3451490.1 unnamed protein product [Rotaria socialis]
MNKFSSKPNTYPKRSSLKNTMLSIFFIFVIASIIAQGQTYSHSSCSSASSIAINLHGLKIDPHPMTRPSVVSFALNVSVATVQTGPIKTQFTLKKEVLFFPVTVPCTDGVGSCTYDDWCEFSKSCSYPLPAGVQLFNMPMNVTSSVPTGKYSVEIRFTVGGTLIGCVTMKDIEVK